MSCKKTRQFFFHTLSIYIIILFGMSESKADNKVSQRFDHTIEAHANKACVSCHPGGADADQVRPGNESHLTCAGGGCHQIFEQKSSKDNSIVCQSCHQNDKPWNVSKKNLINYPPEEKNDRSHCTSFPHKTHLVLSNQPINAQCIDCHQSKDEGPSHSTCSTCHVDPGQPPSNEHATAHQYDACDKCHQPREKRASNLCTKWSVHRRFRVGKRFDHSLHKLDIRKTPPAPMSCGKCHPHVAKHDGYRAGKGRKWIKLIASGAMAKSCGGCHNGSRKNPGNKKRIFSVKDTNACYKCHPNLNFSPRQKKRGHGRNAW